MAAPLLLGTLSLLSVLFDELFQGFADCSGPFWVFGFRFRLYFRLAEDIFFINLPVVW